MTGDEAVPLFERSSQLALLDRALGTTPLASHVFFAGEPCGEWRMNSHSVGRTAFHLVLKGSLWLHRPRQPDLRQQLRPGDFAFFARNAAHVVSATADVPDLVDTVLDGINPVGLGAADQTALICGRLGLEAHAERYLLSPLPEVIVMPSAGAGVPGIVPAIVSSMWDEVHMNEQPLSTTLNKLADVLVVQVLRFAVVQRLVSSGIFAAMSDVQLRRAVMALLHAPQREWTVDVLARTALMSRSTFAARFLSVVGRTPLDFVRDWRMQQAVNLLRTGRSVAEVADASGYRSEASFARAFKRVTGISPGASRAR